MDNDTDSSSSDHNPVRAKFNDQCCFCLQSDAKALEVIDLFNVIGSYIYAGLADGLIEDGPLEESRFHSFLLVCQQCSKLFVEMDLFPLPSFPVLNYLTERVQQARANKDVHFRLWQVAKELEERPPPHLKPWLNLYQVRERCGSEHFSDVRLQLHQLPRRRSLCSSFSIASSSELCHDAPVARIGQLWKPITSSPPSNASLCAPDDVIRLVAAEIHSSEPACNPPIDITPADLRTGHQNLYWFLGTDLALMLVLAYASHPAGNEELRIAMQGSFPSLLE